MAYVYRHIRHDKNQPFYIGIGRTPYRHTAKQNRNGIWQKIASRTSYEVEIIFDDVSWDFACKKEIEFIKLYGRINIGTGTLANMTDGGDGNLGLKHSKEAIEKISKASLGRPGYWKGKKMPKESSDKISAAKKGKKMPWLYGRKVGEKTRNAVAKHSIGNKYHLGHKHSEESKRKMSESKKGAIAYNRLPVFQYGLDGKYIKKYECRAHALNVAYGSEINKVCKGQRKSAGGYMWRDKFEGDLIQPVQYILHGWSKRKKSK